MNTDGTPLHGSYFDLLEDKYPDLERPAATRRPARRPRLRRCKSRSAMPIVLCAAAAIGVAGLAVVLRPEKLTHSAKPTMSQPASPSVASRPDPEQATAAVPEKNMTAARTAPLPKPASKDTRKPQHIPPTEAPMSSRGVRGRPLPLGEGLRGGSDGAQIASETGEALSSEAQAVAPVEPPAILAYQPPRKIFSSPPEYPAVARQAGEEGTVVVAAHIDETGTVTGAQVVRGRSPALDRAAARALTAWRFMPATRGGESVASSYRVGFEFTLQKLPAAARRQPLEVGGDVKPPRRLRSPLPAYPDDAWAEGVTGDVLVRAVIDERGEVAGVEVLRGLPYGMTEAAVEAIRRWKFAPATRDGQPVAVYRNLSVRFET